MARQRRGRDEGSIFRRGDGLWVAGVSMGYDEHGKRKRRTVYGKTKQEVRDKLRELHKQPAYAMAFDAGKLTVADYLTRWLEVSKQSLSPTTHLRYDQVCRCQSMPHVGRLKLSTLTPLHVEQLYFAVAKDSTSDRKPQMTAEVLHNALRQAVRQGLIPANPCDAVARPKVGPKEMQVYGIDEAKQFLTAAEPHRLFALFVLDVMTGMRQGELFGLQWPDISFDTSSLSVQRTLEEKQGQLRLKEPKTAKGRRRIDLPKVAIDALHEHRKRMLTEGRDVKDGPVFCSPEGRLLRKSNFLRRCYYPLLEKASLSRIRFHDLRHTAATLLLMQGEHPKVVQERLGH